ncbi:selenocysteine-specific translation elongation factor [Gordonia neofelifaecis]|uniref:Selenocysteine-specific elongation factor n=1 Tax=Gordonia neofelifaecis NRRL B-59395 TaxID=644548 RepID=F1YEK1_9ACTN|nr:selenocysteine-specific translation elongation factor [Gordonia neofelifaecis]EGD56835.1 selenocysteine-specific translation elongation factor [Gordonia neofelifaecis NRRL B-59395]
MFVVATAGHVDHGKSTLVKALTGMEPDRWEDERRRGLTIDLGFVWTTLASGREVGFVDVPGHERFLTNMLAGLGPAPVVCFVVAADEGWREQSSDHRDALAALGIEHGLLVISRADRATPDRVAEVIVQAREELAGTGLADAPAVVVSALRGDGLDELRERLDRLLERLPSPNGAPVRLWVDRAFTITGAGTVVTGTLEAGSLTPGDHVEVVGRGGRREVVIRGLQTHGRPSDGVHPVSRVAVNLRGIGHDEIGRGDALLAAGSWPATTVVDVRRVSGTADLPEWLTAHVGTAAVPARVRPLDDDHLRLTLARPLPLRRTDRLVLRDPGAARIVGGAEVLDTDPPSLTRRGDARRRAAALTVRDGDALLFAEVAQRGAVRRTRLPELGLPSGVVPDGVEAVGEWLVMRETLHDWQIRLHGLVTDLHDRDPLAAGLSEGAASDSLELPDRSLLAAVVAGAGVTSQAGLLFLPDRLRDLGPAERGVVELERRLAAAPFVAPEADDLAALRLGVRELAAAQRAGRLLRLSDAVVVLPASPALAMRELARLPQPFTTSQARQALGTSRRVAVPLLEHLDSRGWTRRLDTGHREVVRRGS